MGWVGADAPSFPMAYTDVSIPERVWGGLELAQRILHPVASIVSIPERVWGGLERFDIG